MSEAELEHVIKRYLDSPSSQQLFLGVGISFEPMCEGANPCPVCMRYEFRILVVVGDAVTMEVLFFTLHS
jgi:hypothetical protein